MFLQRVNHLSLINIIFLDKVKNEKKKDESDDELSGIAGLKA